MAGEVFIRQFVSR